MKSGKIVLKAASVRFDVMFDARLVCRDAVLASAMGNNAEGLQDLRAVDASDRTYGVTIMIPPLMRNTSRVVLERFWRVAYVATLFARRRMP